MSELAVWQLAYEGHGTALHQLLERDPQAVRSVDQRGRNALHWAACGGHLGLVKALITAGLDKDCKDNSNWTPLMIAVSVGCVDVVEFLVVDEKADVNVVNSTGQCPLHYAASKNRLQICELLFDAGARADVRDWSGTTPLHRAVSHGSAEMVNLLIERGSSGIVNVADNQGCTPLHYACEEGNMSMARLLLEHGASLSCKNADGKLPIELAPDLMRINLQKHINSTTLDTQP